jgi:hypothetical protein
MAPRKSDLTRFGNLENVFSMILATKRTIGLEADQQRILISLKKALVSILPTLGSNADCILVRSSVGAGFRRPIICFSPQINSSDF